MMKTETLKRGDPSLKECFEKQICIKKDAGKERTAANYVSALNKFVTYIGKRKIRSMKLEDINSELIQQYLLWLLEDEESGNAFLAPGSHDFYLRNLKAMYNKSSRDMNFISPWGNPFSKMSVPVPPTRKRTLPKEEIKKLTKLDYSHEPEKLSALHLALFLFYARGMCFVDAFKLTIDNMDGEYLNYVRSKTGVPLQVKITPEMLEIIRLYYRKGTPWLFPFLHYKIRGRGKISSQSSLHRINDILNLIGSDMGYMKPLTTYVMRHSWASMMLEAGIEISIISQSLGHTSLRTTEIYLGQLSLSKMDKASDKMLNEVLRKPGKRGKAALPPQNASYNFPKQASQSLLKKVGMRCKNMLKAIVKKLTFI